MIIFHSNFIKILFKFDDEILNSSLGCSRPCFVEAKQSPVIRILRADTEALNRHPDQGGKLYASVNPDPIKDYTNPNS